MSSAVYKSADGVNWTAATTSAAFGGRAESVLLNYAGKLWLIGGFNGTNSKQDVWYSSDGAGWTAAAGGQGLPNPEFASFSDGSGVVYDGLKTLGQGAILAGLVLGAIVAFIIDKRFWHAAIFSASGAVLTFIGLIHAEKVQWNADGEVTLGYLFLTVVCVLFALRKPTPREPDAAELALLAEEGETPSKETVPAA